MPPVPFLPPELIHEITCHLWVGSCSRSMRFKGPWSEYEPPVEVKSCALVSHSWRQHAQRHLFRSLQYVFDLADLSMITDEDFENEKIKTLRMLYDFLQQSPSIRPYVRCLTLWKNRFVNKRSEVEGATDILVSILIILPEVRNLEVDFALVVPRGIQSRRLLHAFDRISLNWRRADSPGFHEFLHLLSLFGDVGELHLPPGFPMLSIPEEYRDMSLLPKYLKVKKLFASVWNWRPLLDTLLETASLDNVHVLNLQFGPYFRNAPVSHKWTNRASQTLVHLKIQLPVSDKLEHCPNLQTLTFDVVIHMNPGTEPVTARSLDDSLWYAMEPTLDQIIRTPPSHFRLLTYKLLVGSGSPPFKPDTGIKTDDALYQLNQKLERAHAGQSDAERFKVLIILAGINGPVTLDDTSSKPSLEWSPRSVDEDASAAILEYTTQVQDLIKTSLPKLNRAGALQFGQV